MEIEVPVTEAIERERERERERSEFVEREREREMGFWERRRARRLCVESVCVREGFLTTLYIESPTRFFLCCLLRFVEHRLYRTLLLRSVWLLLS